MGPAGREAGETLIETVISTMILGIGVVAVLGAVFAGVSLSGEHRKLTVADVSVKNAAEAVEAAAYVAGATTYAVTVPSGYTASTSVRCVPAGVATTFATSALVACTPDTGLQVVSVTVSAASGGASETTQVLKRSPA